MKSIRNNSLCLNIKIYTTMFKLICLTITIRMVILGCSYNTISNIAVNLSNQEVYALFKPEFSRPELPPNEKPLETICLDYIDQGLLRICFENEYNTELIAKVLNENNSVYYTLIGDKRNEDFPLQYGKYVVDLLKKVGNNEYLPIQSISFSVNIEDPNIAFLNSIQADQNYKNRFKRRCAQISRSRILC